MKKPPSLGHTKTTTDESVNFYDMELQYQEEWKILTYGRNFIFQFIDFPLQSCIFCKFILQKKFSQWFEVKLQKQSSYEASKYHFEVRNNFHKIIFKLKTFCGSPCKMISFFFHVTCWLKQADHPSRRWPPYFPQETKNLSKYWKILKIIRFW